MNNKNIKKSHEEHIKKQNERCFLPNKQKVSYDGLILLDVFHLENFDSLLSGLNEIFEDLHAMERDRLQYSNLITNSPNMLFQKNNMSLPYINHEKLKGKILPRGVYFDLGQFIENVCLILHKVSPSIIILQAHVYFNDKLSSEINEIIYKYHKEEKEKKESENGNYQTIISPEQIKEREISKIRNKIKKKAIDFLSSFFEGYFLSNFKTEIIPSIDLFSLEYPADKVKIKKWSRKNRGFLSCLNASSIEHKGSKFEEYLLTVENKYNQSYQNLLILANKKSAKKNLYGTIDHAVKYRLLGCSFELFGIYRWLKVQQKTVGELNRTISSEIENLEKSKLEKQLSNRKKSSNRVFQFERFKDEFDDYWSSGETFPFLNFCDDSNFFENTKNNISKISKDIARYISMYNRHLDVILNMTNIEFSNKVQKKIHKLTWIMIIFMIIQSIIAALSFYYFYTL